MATALDAREQAQELLRIPVDGLLLHPETGREHVLLHGQPQRVVYDVDAATWRLLQAHDGHHGAGDAVWRACDGSWTTGNHAQWQARPCLRSATTDIALAAPPAIPQAALPLPRRLHYIWIGDDGLPPLQAQTLRSNAGRSGVYRSTLHVHARSAEGLERVREQMRGTSIDVSDLRSDAAFQAMLASPLGVAFRQWQVPATRNAAAASDILRVVLLQAHGGIYLDCDDSIAHGFPQQDLRAAPTDVLLNRWIGAHGLGYFGYNQSCFASQPGNPVLQAMLDEMQCRLQQAGAFLATPRPWPGEGEDRTAASRSPAMKRYIQEILRLTGPGLFNDVLARCRPDYHLLELWLVHAYAQTTWSPREPRYLVNDYMDRMHAAMAHYLPFASGAFEVSIGNADSWNVPAGVDSGG